MSTCYGAWTGTHGTGGLAHHHTPLPLSHFQQDPGPKFVLFSAGFCSKECFRSAQVVTLSGVKAQEFIQGFFAAIERFPTMFLADGFLMPCRHNDDDSGNARAAASSFAFGAGGFSSRSRTRKLSRSESCTCSA